MFTNPRHIGYILLILKRLCGRRPADLKRCAPQKGEFHRIDTAVRRRAGSTPTSPKKQLSPVT